MYQWYIVPSTWDPHMYQVPSTAHTVQRPMMRAHCQCHECFIEKHSSSDPLESQFTGRLSVQILFNSQLFLKLYYVQSHPKSARRSLAMFAFLRLLLWLWRPMFSMSAGHKSNVSAGCKNHFLRRRSFTDGRSFRRCCLPVGMLATWFLYTLQKMHFFLSQILIIDNRTRYKTMQYKKYTMEKLHHSRGRWNSRGSISLQDVDVRRLHWQDVRGEM